MAKKKKQHSVRMINIQKFILNIGDNGAVLTYIENGQVKERLFANSPAQNDRREMSIALSKHPHASIYVLLDIVDQNFTKQSLPAVGMLSIGQLVQRRLRRDFADVELKSALPLGRQTSGRRDWDYLFIAANLSQTLSEWIDFLLIAPNKFEGIYLLPLEVQNFAARFNKYIFKGKQKSSAWQFFVFQNKTGGFRQVVLHDNKVIFTRFVQVERNADPALNAGNLEQELLNTTEYLRRQGFNDQQGMDLIIIASQDVKTVLEGFKLSGDNVFLYTPFEIASLIDLQNYAREEDKFSDVLLSGFFASSPHVLELFTKETQKIHYFILAYKWSFYLMATILPAFILYSLFTTYKIVDSRNKILRTEGDKARIEQQWTDAQTTGDYDIEEANKITDVVSFYNKFQERLVSPIPLLHNINQVKGNNAIVKSFNWRFQGDTNSKVVAVFNLDFLNTGANIEELFVNFDNFNNGFKQQFSNYSIEHSKLPEKITFGEETKKIDIQITLREQEK